MSCNTKTSLAAVIDAVNAQLNNNYVDRDDPRINQGVFTEPTIRGGLMLDEAAKLDFCGYVTECGQREPFGKQWVDRPLYPNNTLVSYEDGGEIKSRWQDTDDVVAGTEIGESYTTYEETRSLGLQGYTIIDSFELGATIIQRNQALRHAATGKLYRWAGDLPKIVPADSTPVNSGGVDTNAWLEVSDTALRQEILTGGLLTDTLVTMTKKAPDAVARNLRDVNSETLSTLDFGLVGDGVTPEQKLLTIAANASQDLKIPQTTDAYYLKRTKSEFVINNSVRLIGINGKPTLENDTPESNTLSIDSNGVTKVDGAHLENLHIKYNWCEVGVPTQTNNYQALSLNADRGFAFNNEIESECMTAARTSYAPASLAENSGDISGVNYVPQYERQHEDVVYLANRVRTNGIGFELFSTRGLKAIGNTVRSKGASQNHGYRVTGYAAMPHMHSSIVGNSTFGTKSGYSVQAGVRYNSINSAITDACGTGVQIINTGDTFYPSRNNYIQAVISNSIDYGVYLDKSIANRFDLVIDNTLGSSSLRTTTGSKHNLVDAVVTNSAGTGLILRDSNSIYRLVIDKSVSNGASISGNNNIIDVVISDSGYAGISIEGSNNVIRVIKTGTYTNASIIVIGSNNTITADCELMRFDSAAKNNTIYGNVREFANIRDNNVGNCAGCSFSKTYYAQTTDAEGKVVITVPNTPKGVATNPAVFAIGAANIIGAAALKETLSNGDVQVTAIFKDFTGAIKADTPVTFVLMLLA